MGFVGKINLSLGMIENFMYVLKVVCLMRLVLLEKVNDFFIFLLERWLFFLIVFKCDK